MADLTVIILTRNEADRLEACIRSVRAAAKRIVVVDSYSDDGTCALAAELGAEVVQHPFESHAAQFNWALEHVNLTTEWVMRLDADEVLTPELAAELQERLDALRAPVNGVILRRRVYFMGRWLKHGGLYPQRLLRIFRTGHGRSEQRQMDEHLILTDGRAVTFRFDFADCGGRALAWWIEKHNRYSDKEVLDRLSAGGGPEPERAVEHGASSPQAGRKRLLKRYGYYRLPRFFRAHLYYLYRYYIRLGFLDGTEGKIFTFLQAYWYRFLVDAKLYECEKAGTRPEEPDGCRGTGSGGSAWSGKSGS